MSELWKALQAYKARAEQFAQDKIVPHIPIVGEAVKAGNIAADSESGLPGAHNGPADAYRHMMVSALLAQKYGRLGSNAIANGRELGGLLQGNPLDEAMMDVRSHKLGSFVGEQNSKLTPEQLEPLIRSLAMKARPGAPGLTDFSNAPAMLPESEWQR